LPFNSTHYAMLCPQNGDRIVTIDSLTSLHPWSRGAQPRHEYHISLSEICPRMPRLTDWVVVLRPTRHKIGHFGEVSPSQSLGLVRQKNQTKRNNSTHSPMKRNALQHKINTSQKLQPGLVAFYDIRPGNKAGLFSEKKISKGGYK